MVGGATTAHSADAPASTAAAASHTSGTAACNDYAATASRGGVPELNRLLRHGAAPRLRHHPRLSFCACHHATSSFVRFSTACSTSSSSAVFEADASEWLHWHTPPTLHEQPTTGSCSDVVASVG